jgi:hypothetical protein
VFQSVTALRYDQMEQAAQVLSDDLGFRSAAATHDAPTIESVLSSLRARLGMSRALFVGVDGAVVGLSEPVPAADIDVLRKAVENGTTRGILTLGPHRYRAVAAPLRAPDLQGRVIFASRLDDREMADLARLSALSVRARIVPTAEADKDLPIRVAGSIAAIDRRITGERILMQASPVASFGEAPRRRWCWNTA